eukprot:183512-Pleurochrysis_carterae.AAC.9
MVQALAVRACACVRVRARACASVRVRARACACVRACASVRERARACAFVRVRARACACLRVPHACVPCAMPVRVRLRAPSQCHVSVYVRSHVRVCGLHEFV